MRSLLLAGLALTIIAFSAGADEPATSTSNGFTLLNKPEAVPVIDYGAGVPVADNKDDPACRVRKTVEAGVAMGGVSGTYAGARLDYGKDDKALARGYAPNPCPKTGFAMSLDVSTSDMEVKRRGERRGDGPRRPFGTED